MSTPVSSIHNLGPAVEEACARAGIRSAEELRELGAHEGYRRMLLSGTRAHFIGYYVLHMALQGRPWNDCKGKEKEALRTRFDHLKSEVSHSTDKGRTALEAALDAIGVIERPKRPT